MTSTTQVRRVKRAAIVFAIILGLNIATVRRSRAEDRLDFKYNYYQEDNGRIQVLTPTILAEHDFSSTLTIKIEGIYNAISGASPTGAPPTTRAGAPSTAATQPYSTYVQQARQDDREGRAEDEHEGGGGDGEHESEGVVVSSGPQRASGFQYVSGASHTSSSGSSSSSSSSKSSSKTPSTTTPAPAAQAQVIVPSDKVPVADATDERTAFNIELIKRIDRHAIGGMVSYSTERDYDSIAVALRDTIDFNRKNTQLSLGGAYSHDTVDAFALGRTEDKDTVDVMIGLTQVIDPKTLFTVNLTLSQVNGFLNDQYKVVELNGVLVPEKRPDNKDKQILYLSLLHYFEAVNGSAEVGYRLYNDSFGIGADTIELAWYQHLGRTFVLSPRVRFYQQNEADFYDVRFSGSPEFYSSDYRLAALNSRGIGLKGIWTPSPNWSFDLTVERYEMEGTDNKTPSDAFPSANIVTVGVRYWF